jgi:peptidyl-dipeptidase A
MKQIVLLVVILSVSCSHLKKESKLQTFIDRHVSQIQPLLKESNLAYWQAACTGDTAAFNDYAEKNFRLRQIYSNKQDFAFLTEMKKSGAVTDPLLARQLELLVNAYTENQIDSGLMKQMVDLAASVEQKFSAFRGQINGVQVSAGQIDEILKNEKNLQKRQLAWEAAKQVGPVVSQDIIALVKLRNQASVKLGYKNYHDMSLRLAEQSQQEVDAVFNELYELSKEPFTALRKEMDERLAQSFHLKTEQLAPWHYQDPFFQEAPAMGDLDLDGYYRDKDIKNLAASFYSGIGLPVEPILANSDLYERDKKNPHAFCTDLDRSGDVRILCNLQNNERWMDTILHELGHAVYDRYHDMNLPFLLRQPAHPFTTEAIAQFFGRCSRQAEWMRDMLQLPEKEYEKIKQVGKADLSVKQLIFARWAMVMYFFEKELYADPDQDLNRLWWQIVAKYQLLNAPPNRQEPDWAAKIHFTIAPCYYHNYLLGEMFASQLDHYVRTKGIHNQSGSFVSCTALGDTLKNRIFAPATRYRWDDMIRRATGEPLTAKYFVQQFIAQ